MSVPGDVKKAIELLRTQPERRLSIGKLAASCGVAPRTLQKHFKQFVGKTPAELRFEVRMDLARRELLRAKANVSIAEIAASSGIAHLGRFASLYRKRFGDSLWRPFAVVGVRKPSRQVSRHRPAPWIGRLSLSHRFVCSDEPPTSAGPSVADQIRVGLMRERWFCVGSPDRARYSPARLCWS